MAGCKINLSAFLYLLWISTLLHELGDWHAACTLPFVRGWRRGGGRLRSSGRVSLRACGGLRFFTRVFACSCGEVGPLARHWESLLAKTGQDFCVHIPAAASVGGALLINSIVLDESLQLYSDKEGERKNINWCKSQNMIRKTIQSKLFKLII